MYTYETKQTLLKQMLVFTDYCLFDDVISHNGQNPKFVTVLQGK